MSLRRRLPSDRHWHLLADVFVEMEPAEFLTYWEVTYEQMALICGCSKGTVKHWFSSGSSRRSPSPDHKFRLAATHYVWMRLGGG